MWKTNWSVMLNSLYDQNITIIISLPYLAQTAFKSATLQRERFTNIAWLKWIPFVFCRHLFDQPSPHAYIRFSPKKRFFYLDTWIESWVIQVGRLEYCHVMKYINTLLKKIVGDRKLFRSFDNFLIFGLTSDAVAVGPKINNLLG